ncbi:MAG: hypothetical protein FWC45_10065, partial [Treponema sp.]|nr:hypothetical protein [Treponema sp.]
MNRHFDSAGIYVCTFGADGCAAFGCDEFFGALKKKKIAVTRVNHWTELKKPAPILVIGTAKNRRVQMLLENAGVDLHHYGSESLFLTWCDIP